MVKVKNMEHILIFKDDIIKYPPIISIINYLLKRHVNVTILGYCSNSSITKSYIQNGVKYYNIIGDLQKHQKLFKLKELYCYRERVFKWVKTNANSDSTIWLFGCQEIWLLHPVIDNYKTILYLFEMPSFNVPIRYKLFCDDQAYYSSFMSQNTKVVCCEYNRAHITKAYFGLKKLPYIIPNKPLISEDFESHKIQLPFDTTDKKIILYQGIFNYPERKLDEFCKAVEYLPKEFVLILMGTESEYKKSLYKKYHSNRIYFLPFYPTPTHLQITKLAYIGILSYNTVSNSILNTLNLLYCAPNKIFEYAKFGIPMLSNDLPALNSIFSKFNAGVCDSICTPLSLSECIINIDNNYELYSQGAHLLYDSVNIEALLNSLLNDWI